MATLKERLDAYDGQPEQQWTSRKNLSVGENGKKYSLTMSQGYMSAVYGVDGGIINDKTTIRCDKLILIETASDKWSEVFVELKGQDIPHAIEQLESSLQNPLFKDANVNEKHARVIGSSIPRNTGNSKIEIAKKRFVSRYNCRLKIMSSPGKESYPFQK